ncbi:hypothetical protein DNU06_07670 [Putridiphycobacter roseus]|uniref:Paraquat-inducible protein A n=1 Tax=Putridiphycobacter roseus TaxID=2219161 RepID=A0A2W1MZP5_9FLAO|nr:paraquat-inducible protein A [Putridiphycobacter roseus]PZE17699.1 hypothetical protein DNU06_07670 [Putridiphycobacter roseus]
MKKHWFLILLTFLFLLTTVFISNKIVINLNAYRALKNEIATVLDFDKRILTTKEWVPFTDESTLLVRRAEKLFTAAEIEYQKASVLGVYFGAVVLVFLSGIWFYFRSKWNRRSALGLALIIASFSLVYLGLQTPFLELEAFSRDIVFEIPIDVGFYQHTFEKKFEGKVSYFYQNKSVIELIKLLFTGGNILVGIVLLLASVVFPITKLTLSAWYFIFPKNGFSEKLLKVIKAIGKWSMADVFVAGIFLAYFAFTNMNVGVTTNANTLIGLYFYLGFVVLSICSGYFMLNKKQ